MHFASINETGGIVQALSGVIEARSMEDKAHVSRVAAICEIIGKAAGLTDDKTSLLKTASHLHDIGKIGVPENILNKPGKLTQKEFEIVKTHTTIGAHILRNCASPTLQTAATIAHQHHERWDGTGYPQGLKKQDISLMARITTVADVYDALLSSRSYKDPWSHEKTLSFITEESGRMFDPEIANKLLTRANQIFETRLLIDEEHTAALNLDFAWAM